MTESELRELDAEVHRKVVGGAVWWELNTATGDTRPCDAVPRYSSDMNAAMLVVEKMRERVAGFELYDWMGDGYDAGESSRWLADFGNALSAEALAAEGLNPCTGRAEATGPTAAVAVCRAALNFVNGVWSRGPTSRQPKEKRVKP